MYLICRQHLYCTIYKHTKQVFRAMVRQRESIRNKDCHSRAELQHSHNFLRILLRHCLRWSRYLIRYQPWNIVRPNRTCPTFPHHCNWSWPETENAVARARCVTIEVEQHIYLPASNVFGSLVICHTAQVYPVLNRLRPHKSFSYCYLNA